MASATRDSSLCEGPRITEEEQRAAANISQKQFNIKHRTQLNGQKDVCPLRGAAWSVCAMLTPVRCVTKLTH